MPIAYNIYSIIVSATTANFTAHTYNAVYAAQAATPTINGSVTQMAAGTTLPISVNSISATPNVFLLGENATVAMGGLSTNGGATTIGGSYGG